MSEKSTIICVDDEKIILDSLSSLLTRNFGNSYNYEFAESANEALEIIDRLSPGNEGVCHVVISDWQMPEMNGVELLNEASKRLSNVKTILLTGHVDSALVQAVEQTGDAITCMFKPWNEAKLINVIKS